MNSDFVFPNKSKENSGSRSFGVQIKALHQAVAARYPVVDRIAIANYEVESDTLRTFVSSSADGVDLRSHSARLADLPSLMEVVVGRKGRVIAELAHTFSANTKHTQWLLKQGYRSSFTLPIFDGTSLAAVVFFDSKVSDAFNEDVCSFLETIANLIGNLHLLQTQMANSITGIVSIVTNLAKIRDHETGQHLQRIAAYASLIAAELSRKGHALTDEKIAYIHTFAPLHDIGKVGIPDSVLLKPGKLDPAEWEIMKTHVQIGESIAMQMGKDLAISNKMAFDVLVNIIACHHERGDGSGYPRGLLMEEIPIEARIVAVADIYDALSTPRPYKSEWSEDRIREELQTQGAQRRLDPECVEALLGASEERNTVHRKLHAI